MDLETIDEVTVDYLRSLISDEVQTIKLTIAQVDDPLRLIRAGVFPDSPPEDVYPENWIIEVAGKYPNYGISPLRINHIMTLYLEDLLKGTSSAEIEFYYGSPTPINISHWFFWKYSTINTYVQDGIQRAESLPLILYAPDKIYKESRRPINDMAMFRTPGAITASRPTGDTMSIAGVTWSVSPVTRYGAGMSSGLYFPEDPEYSFCGTFIILNQNQQLTLVINVHW